MIHAQEQAQFAHRFRVADPLKQHDSNLALTQRREIDVIAFGAVQRDRQCMYAHPGNL